MKIEVSESEKRLLDLIKNYDTRPGIHKVSFIIEQYCNQLKAELKEFEAIRAVLEDEEDEESREALLESVGYNSEETLDEEIEQCYRSIKFMRELRSCIHEVYYNENRLIPKQPERKSRVFDILNKIKGVSKCR